MHAAPAPGPDHDPGRGSRWQHRLPSQIATTDPLGPRHVDTDRLQTIPAAFAAWDRSRRNLRRMLARAAADHLFRAAALLREVPSTDALVLAAAGTAEALYALDDAAQALGGMLPAELSAAADQLPGWAAALKQRHQAAAAASSDTRLALPRPPRWRRR